jgi:hypothetical protein
MKPSVSPHMVAFLILGMMAPLSAQNLASVTRSSESGSDAIFVSVLPDKYEIPVKEKAAGRLPASRTVYAAQDSLTLDTRSADSRKVESVVDLSVLSNPSPYRKVAVSTGGQPYEVTADGLETGLALISAVYRESGKREQTSDCNSVALSAEQRIRLDISKVLEVVESEVTANPSCACEIVKTAIKASEADVAMVVSIVETSINAAPDSMRIVSQCAIAAMPEAIGEVQALLARLDPNSGDADVYSSKSAKSAKSAKVAAIVSPAAANPLDLPPTGPPIMPPPIIPPPVTEVNPCVGYAY